MSEVTWIPQFLRGAVWVYFLVWFVLIVATLLIPSAAKKKASITFFVSVVFGILPAYLFFNVKQHNNEMNFIAEERKTQYEKAMAQFENRCKSAGEKIYRTIDDVEGVLLINVRAPSNTVNWADPTWPDSGLPHEPSGEDYIRSFLYWEQHQDKRESRGYLNYSISNLPGYRFVDILLEDKSFKRIYLEGPENTKLVSKVMVGKPTRYSVEFNNFIDLEDRILWIAGTKVTIADTVSKEVIAEKTWYSIDPGQGSTAEFRSPWQLAKTCPEFIGWSGGATRFFVDQVLKIKKVN